MRDELVEIDGVPPRPPSGIESVMAFLGDYESDTEDLSIEVAEFWTLAKHADGSDWVVAAHRVLHWIVRVQNDMR